jgi:hypothetical protein
VLSGEKGGEKSPLQSQSFYRDQRIRITADVSTVVRGAPHHLARTAGVRLRGSAHRRLRKRRSFPGRAGTSSWQHRSRAILAQANIGRRDLRIASASTAPPRR